MNEVVAGGRKRRDSRSSSVSPREKRRRSDLNPSGKRPNPLTPPSSPLEDTNLSLPPVSQPVANLPQPPGILSDKPPIHNVHSNQNIKIPVPNKKRKLPDAEAWSEQRKQAKQSVNPQLRKLQQLHHNKQHSQGNSAFTAPAAAAKDKLESSKDISSILRNACMVPNTSNAKQPPNSKLEGNKRANHENHKNDKMGSRRKEILRSKALRKIYEENTRLRQIICKQIRTLGQGECIIFRRGPQLYGTYL